MAGKPVKCSFHTDDMRHLSTCMLEQYPGIESMET